MNKKQNMEDLPDEKKYLITRDLVIDILMVALLVIAVILLALVL
jgi:hypothetical protein